MRYIVASHTENVPRSYTQGRWWKISWLLSTVLFTFGLQVKLSQVWIVLDTFGVVWCVVGSQVLGWRCWLLSKAVPSTRHTSTCKPRHTTT